MNIFQADHHNTMLIRLIILTSLSVKLSCAFYIPGVAPVEFKKGDKIEVRAVKMTSTQTQLPFEYYSLPFCPPKNRTYNYKSENLGE